MDYSQQRIIIAAFLTDMRKGSGMSRSEIAKELGITEQVIDEREFGKRHMDIAELRGYCWAIGLSLTDCIEFLVKMFDKFSNG